MRNHIGMITVFSLYTFFYLVLELAINDYAEPIVGSGNVTTLYGCGYLTLAFGYPLYALASRFLSSGPALRIATIVVGSVGGVAFLILSFTSSSTVFIPCALLSHLASGYIGGAVYYHAAMVLQSSKRVGFTIGIAYAAANFVQALGLIILSFLSIPVGRWVERVALLCALVLVIWYASTRIVSNKQPLEKRKGTPSVIKRYILGGIAAMALIALLQGVNDGIATALHANNDGYLVYGIPRLFVIPGLMIAGVVADLKDRRFFPFATMLAMIIMAAATLLFSSPETYYIATCFLYFFGSFMSLFSVVPFIQWAPETSHPALVSIAGRSVRYAFSGIAIIMSGALFSTTSNMAVLIIYLALLALLFSVFFFMGQLRLPPRQSQMSPDAFQAFAFQHSLTDREIEILVLLCDGLATAEIGEKLFIADKTVRNHVSNMLTKTGNESRAELLESIQQAKVEYEFGR